MTTTGSDPALVTVPPAIPSLRRNFGWTISGNVVYAACQWGMLVVLAKLLTPAEVGQFALALAITAPPTILAGMRLRSAVATDPQWQYRFGEYMTLRLIATLLITVVLAVVGFAGYDRQTGWVILVVAVTKGVDLISDMVQGLFQHAERHDLAAIGMAVNGIVSLVAMGVVVWWTRSVLAGTVASLLGSTVALIGFNLPLTRRFVPEGQGIVARLDVERLKSLTLLTWPLGASSALGSLYTNVPRYFLEHQWGRGALGIYSALAYLLVAGTLVVNALAQAAAPRMARSWQGGDLLRFRQLTYRLVGVGVLLGAVGIAGAIALGPWALRLLYRPEYAEHADIFVLLSFAALASYIYACLANSLSAMRRFSEQFPINVAGFVALAIAAWWGVPRYGMAGAAWALIIGGGVQAALYSIYVIPVLRGLPAATR